ncbi:MAG: redox-regulated ATPase YchF [Desulfobulbaceae bacterium]|nr:redox-regulated ATPase YchF [Desulfobulbaceae bacterium]
MKVGIIGLPQTGKKTLFQVLTGNELREQAGPAKPIPGTAEILDPRFDTLMAMYEPKKEARARIELMLLPKMEQENIAKGDIFRDIADVDALCHVVRAFEDDAVYHAEGSVNPLRDAEMVNSELIMHDQIFVEKRIERIEKALKKIKDENQAKELELMQRMQTHLEEELPLRLLQLNEDEEFLTRSYPFITTKELIIAFNVSEDQLADSTLLQEMADQCKNHKMEAMLVSAQVESEIVLLDSEEEKAEFLQDLGIEEPALGIMTRLCLSALGLISFFTVGKDEVRQWLVRRDSSAPVAAGVIHSDLQRGFIRAELMKYDELIELGSEAELKKAGKMYLQGKDYTVIDGDILNIRFKV